MCRGMSGPWERRAVARKDSYRSTSRSTTELALANSLGSTTASTEPSAEPNAVLGSVLQEAPTGLTLSQRRFVLRDVAAE